MTFETGGTFGAKLVKGEGITALFGLSCAVSVYPARLLT